MKGRSTLIIACLALALLLFVGTTRAEAECCLGNVVAAPFVVAGTIVEGAVMGTAAVITAPFTAFGCNNCRISLCNPCSFPKITFTPCGHC